MSNIRRDISNNSAPYSQMKLLYITTSQFGVDWHSTPHMHSCLELFYCVSGAGQFRIESETLDVQAGDLVVINPGVEHTEISFPDTPLEYIALGIEGLEFLFDSDRDIKLRLHNFNNSKQNLLYILQTMLYEADEKPEGHERVCENLLEILITYLMRQNAYKISDMANVPINKECSAAKRYIDSNYTEHITLDFLADLLHVNKFYLVHSFHKEYGISPINYLIDRRIRESKYLLTNTNYSLSQISNLMGFSSSSYFSQSFRRQEHLSPNEYRKINKSN
ncbi:MAG: AraC family transcriptional regulator [Oscillospiraceae bacterium]